MKTSIKAFSILAGLVAATSTASAATISFEWTSAPFIETRTFTADSAFDLVLDTYTGRGQQKSSYILLDGNGTRLTTQQPTDCNAAGGLFVGGCNHVYADTDSGTLLLANLAAGDYTIGVAESRNPDRGQLSFNTVAAGMAAVPVPAAGGMLLLALGGLVLRKRRAAA